MPADEFGVETRTRLRSGRDGEAGEFTSAISKWPAGYAGFRHEQASGSPRQKPGVAVVSSRWHKGRWQRAAQD